MKQHEKKPKKEEDVKPFQHQHQQFQPNRQNNQHFPAFKQEF